VEKKRRTPISENTHRHRVSKAISAAYIKTSKKTHILRLYSGKTPAMMELHSDLRRQQGRWNNTAMDKCYSDLPLPAIRSLAGFSGPGSFFLPRGTVKPPEELVELLYPAPLDTWIRKKDDGAIHDGLTTEQFIKVLKFLRVVFCRTLPL
jgi:hypothetical protein